MTLGYHVAMMNYLRFKIFVAFNANAKIDFTGLTNLTIV